jgi:hypothetical protein
MYLPKQSKPVLRTILAGRSGSRASDGSKDSGIAIPTSAGASAHGVQPSGWIDDILQVTTALRPISPIVSQLFGGKA